MHTTSPPESFRLAKPARYLSYSFLLFLFFGVTQNFDDLYRVFFFFGVLPSAVILLFRRRLPENLFTKPLLLATLALLTVLFLSVFWSDTEHYIKTVLRYSRWFLWTSIFYVAMFVYGYLGLHRTSLHRQAIQVAIILGASFSIVVYFQEGRFPQRLTGPGMLGDIIMGSSLLTILWTMSLFDLNSANKKQLTLTVVALALVLAYAFLNQSRAPLIVAIFAGSVFLTFLAGSLRRKLFVACTLFLVALLLIWTLDSSMLLNRMAERGASYRFTIWEAALKPLDEYFWLGYGLASQLSETGIGDAIEAAMGYRHNHSHNLFLTVFAHGGVVSFVLIISIFLAMLYRSTKLTGQERVLMITAVLVLIGLCFTDPYKIITSPQATWLLIWFPVGVISGSLSRGAFQGHWTPELDHLQGKRSPPS